MLWVGLVKIGQQLNRHSVAAIARLLAVVGECELTVHFVSPIVADRAPIAAEPVERKSSHSQLPCGIRIIKPVAINAVAAIASARWVKVISAPLPLKHPSVAAAVGVIADSDQLEVGAIVLIEVLQ